MRILITGAQGQLGHALQQALSGEDLILKDLPDFDLTQSDCESQIVAACPSVILHVGNFVHATRLALQQPRNGQPAYVVTDETPYEISEIYDLLRAGLGKTIPKWRMPLWMLKMGATCGDMIQAATGRSVPVNSSTLEKLIRSAGYSAAAITEDLGYCPPYRFIDAVPEMIRFYRASLR